MDLSPEPPNNARLFRDTEAPHAMRAALEDLLRPALGDAAPDLAASWASFLRAANRFQDGVFELAELSEPALKQMGMGIGALLLRTRELAGHFRELEAAAERQGPSLPEHTEERDKGRTLIERALAHSAHMWPVPEWELEQGAWLSRTCRAVFQGCKGVSQAMTGLATGRRPGSDVLDIALAVFRDEAGDALYGDNGLLKDLPRLQTDLSGRIYASEFSE
jgi:hypothetical protein